MTVSTVDSHWPDALWQQAQAVHHDYEWGYLAERLNYYFSDAEPVLMEEEEGYRDDEDFSAQWYQMLATFLDTPELSLVRQKVKTVYDGLMSLEDSDM